MLRIFTTATCGYCRQAKSFMDQRDISYAEVRVDLDTDAAHELVHKTGQRGVPVITDGKQYVVGFDPHAILHLADVPHGH